MELSNDDIIKQLSERIHECETVVKELAESRAWKIIVRDLSDQKQTIDDHWHEITEDKKLDLARQLKFAYAHLLSLVSKYAQDLEEAKKELEKIQNPKENIVRDYDAEGT